ncbi:MAG TPA: hypothetical protein VKP66_00425 [Steroidobacteraceae bacterium]|nr:hypothetical protein [Steroidobacteraceae bacterium]
MNKMGKWVKSTGMKYATLTKQTDSKGRLTLGESFANATVLVEANGEGEVIVKRARVIPAREAWLYENKEALASVRRGLKQAREHQFVPGPDLTAAAELAEQLQDV